MCDCIFTEKEETLEYFRMAIKEEEQLEDCELTTSEERDCGFTIKEETLEDTQMVVDCHVGVKDEEALDGCGITIKEEPLEDSHVSKIRMRFFQYVFPILN